MINHNGNHHRQSIRYLGYDYTLPGGYFITVVSYQRENLFGSFENGQLVLSKLGMAVKNEWLHSAQLRKELRCVDEEMVLMPNHLHGIVWIEQTFAPEESTDGDLMESQSQFTRKSRSLGSFIAGFKSKTTAIARKEFGISKIWQRNFYDHIIRGYPDYERIFLYIQENPFRWIEDQLFHA
jgi:REP element-mobilizing transposase RayT